MLRTALVFGLGVFAISFGAIFVRLAEPAPPVVSALYRIGLATALLWLWLALRRRLPRLSPRAWAAALLAGLCFAGDLGVWHIAVLHTSVANASLLVNTTPIHVGIVAVLAGGEPLRRSFVVGAALSLAGTAVLLGSDLGGDSLRGDLLALLAAVFYSGYLLLMKRVRRELGAAPAWAVAGLGASAALLAWALLRGDPLVGFPTSSWVAMGSAALVSQLAGVLGVAWTLRYLRATFASVGLLGQPLSAAVLGWLFFGEVLTPLQGLGGGVVLVGILLASEGAADPRAGPPMGDAADPRAGPPMGDAADPRARPPMGGAADPRAGPG